MVSTMLEVHSQSPSLSSLPDVQPPPRSQTQHATAVRTTPIGKASDAPTLHIPPTSPIWTARAVPIPSSALSHLFWTVHPPLVDAELKCPPALPTPNTNREEMRQPSPVLSAQPPATPQTHAGDDVLAAKRQLGMSNTITTASLPGSLKTPSQNGPRRFRTPPTAPRAMREGRLQTFAPGITVPAGTQGIQAQTEARAASRTQGAGKPDALSLGATRQDPGAAGHQQHYQGASLWRRNLERKPSYLANRNNQSSGLPKRGRSGFPHTPARTQGRAITVASAGAADATASRSASCVAPTHSGEGIRTREIDSVRLPHTFGHTPPATGAQNQSGVRFSETSDGREFPSPTVPPQDLAPGQTLCDRTRGSGGAKRKLRKRSSTSRCR